MSATVWRPVIRILSSLGPSCTFTLQAKRRVSTHGFCRAFLSGTAVHPAQHSHVVEQVGPAMSPLKRLRSCGSKGRGFHRLLPPS